MEYRSTSARFTHFGGQVVSAVESSHGVEVGYHPTSTGAAVHSVGDDTSITLSLFAKGAGAVVIGNASNAITLGNGSTLLTLGSTGSQIQAAGSTAPWEGVVRFIDTAVTTPALFNDTTCGRVAETTHVLTGVSSQTAGGLGSFLFARSENLPAAVAITGAWIGSTAADVHVRFVKGSTVAVAGTTATLNFVLYRFRP